jgi:hypothetical protein
LRFATHTLLMHCVLLRCTEVHTKADFWRDYAAEASAVARSRLRLGGARLAQVLNSLHAEMIADAPPPAAVTTTAAADAFAAADVAAGVDAADATAPQLLMRPRAFGAATA